MSIFNAFDNIFGGHDYTIDNNNYQTHSNLLGGQDIYENGLLVASTQENILGGVDIFEGGQLTGHTQENVLGGYDVFSMENGLEGTSLDTVSGIDFLTGQDLYSFDVSQTGNANTILGYSDPLAHMGNYVMPTMIL